ncbi:MAG TPA: alpha/beta fold hydrolase [Rhizomicrobium sp.]|nr:alpha/beta fold hydrolase [Rhizomicrobium sp.]
MALHLQGKAESREVSVGPLGLPGTLQTPKAAFALIIFAHGSGSSRLSPRNRLVADALNRKGMATLLFDLLRPEEEPAHHRAKVFDIPLLSQRLSDAVRWVDQKTPLANIPIGLFGASTGAAAALTVAAKASDRIGAVVSRGGRPDMAADSLIAVRAPTLLIVGGADYGVIELNEQAFAALRCEKVIEIVPGATHLFEEPGAMERVIALAAQWFEDHLETRR